MRVFRPGTGVGQKAEKGFAMRRKSLLVLCLGLGLLLLVAPARADGGTLLDAAGRRISTSRPYTRIISLYGAHTENLFALGLGREIIGVSPHEVYPAAARKKPVFSYHDGPEKFIAARPDLVLIRPMIDRGYRNLFARLEKSGIVVVSLQPHGIGGLYRYWLELGRLTGREPAAREMVERFKREVAGKKALVAGYRPRKRVYFEAIHRRMKTFAPGALALFCLDIGGGVNVAGDAKPVRRGSLIAPYGKERIISHAAEIDVFLAQKGTMNRVSVETILDEPGFQVIKAVREKQVFLVDETIISRPTPRLLLGIDRIRTILYPGLSRR